MVTHTSRAHPFDHPRTRTERRNTSLDVFSTPRAPYKTPGSTSQASCTWLPKLTGQLAEMMESCAANRSHRHLRKQSRVTHGHERDGAMHSAEAALGVCGVVWYDRWKVPKVQDCSMHLHVSHTGTSCCLARCKNVHVSNDGVEARGFPR